MTIRRTAEEQFPIGGNYMMSPVVSYPIRPGPGRAGRLLAADPLKRKICAKQFLSGRVSGSSGVSAHHGPVRPNGAANKHAYGNKGDKQSHHNKDLAMVLLVFSLGPNAPDMITYSPCHFGCESADYTKPLRYPAERAIVPGYHGTNRHN